MKNFYSTLLLWLFAITCCAQATLENIALTHAESFAYLGLGDSGFFTKTYDDDLNSLKLSAEQRPFITTWETTEANEWITIPTNSSYSYNYAVDWGDGTADSTLTGTVSHTYATPGGYTVQITGDFPGIYFNTFNPQEGDNATKIQSIEQWGDIAWETMNSAFQGCTKLTSNASDTPDLSQVTDMSWMFYYASSFNGNLSNWEVANVTNMSWMFGNASSFNGNLSNWEVSKVTNMSWMFGIASRFNGDLSDWEVAQVTDMSSMFRNASSFNRDLSNWDVSKVTDMSWMFDNASRFNGNLSDWEVAQVTNMLGMFNNASSFNADLSNWEVSKVTDMESMLLNTAFSKENYEKLLNGWSEKPLQDSVRLDVDAIYCNATAAREKIINDFGWTINDGGKICSVPDLARTEAVSFVIDHEIYIGLGANETTVFSDFYRVNPIEGTAQPIANFPGTARTEAVAFVIDGVAYVGTGRDAALNSLGDFYAYDPDTDRWTAVASLPSARYSAVAFALEDAGYIGTGMGETDELDNFHRYDPLTDTWAAISSLSGEKRQGATAFVVEDRAFVTGGFNVDESVTHLSDLQVFDPIAETWTEVLESHPALAFGGATAFAAGGKGYIAYGNQGYIATYDPYDSKVRNLGDVLGIATEETGDNVRAGILSAVIDSMAYLGFGTSGTNTKTYYGDLNPLEITTKQRPFITTWETTEANESITIPTNSNYYYNYAVNWGDGTTESNLTGNISHTYSNPGIYTVQITGDFPSIYFENLHPREGDNATKIRSIEQWGDIAWETMDWAFTGCTKLTSNASDAPDLFKVIDMAYMFSIATSFNGDLSNWDVSNVTDMRWMFNGASNFNGDLSNWEVSKVTNMSRMFVNASSFNSDLSNWDVGNVFRMSSMFENASSFNGDLSNWDVSNVTDMSSMFWDAISFNGDLNNWDVSNVTDMFCMFSGASSFNGNLSNWDVSNVGDMWSMFENASSFNSDLSNWDVSNVFRMSSMFENASSFNSDLSNWDVSNVFRMSSMFENASSFNGDISDWDVSNVMNMSHMFENASSFNSDLSNWDVSNVTDMGSMFENASSFNGDISDWDVSNVGDMWSMFENASSFNGDLSNWDVSNVTDMSSMFWDAISFNGDLNNWDVSNVTDMFCMFCSWDTTSFNGNISNWDVSNVTDMRCMFCGATSFNGNISNWDVSNVTDMSGMFYFAISFNGDISNWDVSNVTEMELMFDSATSFNGDLSTWDVSNVTEMEDILMGSGISLENYDKLLIEWSKSSLQQGVTFGASARYCNAEEERQKIINDFGWTIEDEGQNCAPFDISLSSHTFYENEKTSSPLSIGDVIVIDDRPELFDFLIEGEDANSFTISNGTLFPDTLFDYEVKSFYNIIIVANDGDYALEKPFTIEILDDTLDHNPGFIFTWETTSSNESMRLPMDDSLTYTYTVIWGDGYANRALEEEKNHSYSAPGVYTVEVYGDFPRFNSRAWDASSQLLAIEQWGDIQWSTMENAFFSCEKLVINATDIPDLSQVTSTQGMFGGCESLTEGNLKNWEVANVSDMSAMFIGASAFDENIGSWDVSNVKEMNFMFALASVFNQDISGWDVSNVENMNGLFAKDTVFNQDISGWDVSLVTSMRSIFYHAKSFDQDLGRWNVGNVESFGDHQPFGGVFNEPVGGAFQGSGLSVANYDAMLIGWSQLDSLQTGVELIATDKNFCASYQERESLINNFGWVITDAGLSDLCGGTNNNRILSVLDNSDLNNSDFINSNLIIYPNPASDLITVASDKQIDVTIYDLTGNLLLEQDKNTIDVSLLASGVYILKVFEANGEAYSFRFQKE